MARVTTVNDIDVTLRGDVPEEAANYARDRIPALGDELEVPILFTRVRLTHATDPSFDRPYRAQGNLIFKGRLVRAVVAGRTAHESVDLLYDRLRNQLVRHKPHWESRRGSRPSPEPNEWRRISEPAHRPSHFPRPADEREVIRHKAFAPQRINPDEAAWEMDQLDYDFHLFTDEQTARDAVVYRSGPTGYRMARVDTGPEPDSQIPITLSPQPAARLSFDEARERLELSGQPFVFFVDRHTDAGCVLYIRYDGHYGLITPSSR
jgi:ribosome-associated translation inhibitor RaiA